MAKSTVAVRFTGDTADLKRSLDNVDSKLKSTGSKLASFGKVAAIGLGGLAVGGAALAKGFVEAAVESQKVTKQTAAVIKSMGGAANVTAKQVAELSTELSMQTGIDDELIQSGENILLTFGNIRNEVGKGNDIFDQATEAALDMSVALGTDMASASMQVGKALNDPVAGLNKLKRSGIQFSKQQEDQIKAMVKVGNVAGAQKVMLAELSRQFGGSAEAQATAQDKLKVAWGNLQEQIGEKLLPVVERLATWLAERLPGAFRMVGRVIGPIVKKLAAFWSTLTTGFTEDEGTPIERFALVVREALKDVARWFGDVANAIADFADKAGPPIRDWIDNVLGDLRKWWEDHGPKVIAAVKAVRDGVKLAFEALIRAGKFVMDHWVVFRKAIEVMAVAVIPHFVAIGVAAVASSVKQVAAWVTTQAAVIKTALVHSAQIAIMVAKWAWLAARAAFHAAAVATSWVITSAGASAASAKTIAAATAQGGAWAGLAAAAETNSARIAKAWLAALGPAAAVIAAAEAINKIVGSKEGDPAAGNSLWDNLTRNPFDGMDFDIPFFADGGVMPGPRGRHSLAMVAGGETILPTHRSGFSSGPQIIQVVLDGRVLGEVLANRATVDNRNRAA